MAHNLRQWGIIYNLRTFANKATESTNEQLEKTWVYAVCVK